MRSWRGAVVTLAAVVVAGGLAAVGVLVWLPASADSTESTTDLEGDLRVEVLEVYPHDPAAFTQGLELHDGLLYESTGRRGASDARVVAYETGEIVRQEPLDSSEFGEGLTIVDDVVWQLTWQEGYAFRRDRETLAALDQVPFEGEGWGLCHDPDTDRLVMTDGSAEMTFRDPATFDPIDTVTVTRDGAPLPQINELECVDGQVWANVWMTDDIVRIDPETGEVMAVVDASGLLSDDEAAAANVLNGIAAVPDSDTFLITGKLWPSMFLVQFVPAE